MTHSSHDRPAPSGLLGRWANFAAHNPWRVVAGWVVALVILAGAAATVGGSFVDDFELPGAESQTAIDLLQERFPQQSGDSAQLVFQADAGVTSPETQARIEAALAEAATLPQVAFVQSPFTPEGQGQISRDGTIAFANVQYAVTADAVETASVDALTDLIEETSGDGLTVEGGGAVIAASEIAFGGTAELIGIGAAILILLFTFGSVIAMGLPIMTALAGLASGLIILTIAASAVNLSTITPAFAAMIGLGVGIDYALLIVNRYREQLADGDTPQRAIVAAMDTAGRSVLFAGAIVVIAMLGFFVVGIPFVFLLGVAGAVTVVFTMISAVTILPAVLALIGSRIDRWTVPSPRSAHAAPERSVGYRLVSAIQRRPLIWGGATLALIALLAFPMTDARLGSADAGNNPDSLTSRRAYDLLAEGFGPGFNGPLLLTIENEDGLDPARLAELQTAIQGQPNVAFVSPATPNEANDTAVMQVVPASAPQDEATTDLIESLRATTIPAVLEGTGTDAFIGGLTATYVDLGEQVTDALVPFILLVVGLSVVILATVFRSVVIPLTAAVLNLLSFGAAYGVLVVVFQWGWFSDLTGIDRTGPIESFLPLMVFGILFGLSMDYEVFLVSRIRETFLRTGETGSAVRLGTGMTGRVILAAGAIMTSVFAAFFLEEARVIKELGLGLATAIVVDVLLVRMILVPTTMHLFGRANWWFPGWLDRLLPRLDIEGHATPEPRSGPVPAGAEAD